MRLSIPSLLLACSFYGTFVSAQDTSLHDHLLPERGWQEVASSFAMTDGLCTDAEGHLYFSDVREGEGIYRIDAVSGEVELAIPELPGISGMQIGPDGRFYACQNRSQRIIAVSLDGEVEVLKEGVKCNDLVVTRGGDLYFTETPTQQVHLIRKDGSHAIVDEGSLARPNGITLSPDEATLVVSDHGGIHVWTWQIGKDGRLSAPSPFMTMRTPEGIETASGDGSTTDEKGRYFVTTAVGIQIFDPAGRLAGVIAKPAGAEKVVSVEFAGANHDHLFVAAGDRIFARPTSTRGHFR